MAHFETPRVLRLAETLDHIVNHPNE